LSKQSPERLEPLQSGDDRRARLTTPERSTAAPTQCAQPCPYGHHRDCTALATRLAGGQGKEESRWP